MEKHKRGGDGETHNVLPRGEDDYKLSLVLRMTNFDCLITSTATTEVCKSTFTFTWIPVLGLVDQDHIEPGAVDEDAQLLLLGTNHT